MFKAGVLSGHKENAVEVPFDPTVHGSMASHRKTVVLRIAPHDAKHPQAKHRAA